MVVDSHHIPISHLVRPRRVRMLEVMLGKMDLDGTTMYPGAVGVGDVRSAVVASIVLVWGCGGRDRSTAAEDTTGTATTGPTASATADASDASETSTIGTSGGGTAGASATTGTGTDGSTATVGTTGSLRCVPESTARLGVGEPPRTGATMRWFLEHATQEALAWQPDAQLVWIVGTGLLPDGTADLSLGSGTGSWLFHFESPSAMELRQFGYNSTDQPYPAWGGGTYMDSEPIDVDRLVDSDAIASELMSDPRCPALPGNAETNLRISAVPETEPSNIHYILDIVSPNSGLLWEALQGECFEVKPDEC